jgi:hypothetical protein
MNADPRFTTTPFTPEGPQPLLRQTPPGAVYPVAALGPLRAAVEAVQGMTQAPVALAAGTALAVGSLAVQGHADVETLGGDRPCSLFVLRCLIPGFDGAISSSEWKDALWARYYMEAPRRRGLSGARSREVRTV